MSYQSNFYLHNAKLDRSDLQASDAINIQLS